jgi:hypothetical protein
MRLWYARRGVAWTPLLGCCLLALVAAGAGHRWPEALWLLQPAALACCAAAAGFVHDEAATQVVAVTPRGGGWRRSTRLGVVLVPLGVWAAVVAAVPATADPDRAGWTVAGAGCLLVAAGTAGTCARREVPAPGGQVAAGVAVLVLMPLVVGPILGWDPLLPQGPFEPWLVALWSTVAGVGAALAGWTLLAPSPHRARR